MRRVLQFALWLAAGLSLAGFLLLAVRAIRDPGPGGPVETAVLEQAARVAAGRPAFLEPLSGDGVALMPAFPFAVSPLVGLFDPHPWEPRLLSLLATLIAAALVGVVVRAETRSATLGAAGAGFVLIGEVLASSGPLSDGPGSLLLLLGLAGCLAIRFVPGFAGALLASALLAAACFTHPAGLWFAFAALLHLAVHDRPRLAVYAPTLAVLVGGGHVLLSRVLGPWFNWSAWDAPLRAMRPEPVALVRYIGQELLGTFGVLTLATVLAFALPVRPWRGATGVWTWTWFAALAAGFAATQSAAGRGEALRPAVMALAIVGPVSIRRVTHHLSAWPGSSRLGGQGVVLTALTLQFLMLLSHLTPALFGWKA